MCGNLITRHNQCQHCNRPIANSFCPKSRPILFLTNSKQPKCLWTKVSAAPLFSQVAHQMPPLVALTPQLAQTLLTLPMICSEDSLWVMIVGTSSYLPLPRRHTPGRFSLEDYHQTLMKVTIVFYYLPGHLVLCMTVACSFYSYIYMHGFTVYLTSLSDDIRSYFKRFGLVTVDWPHKSHSKGCIPPKGIYTSYVNSKLM